jgi:hypothetical protein
MIPENITNILLEVEDIGKEIESEFSLGEDLFTVEYSSVVSAITLVPFACLSFSQFLINIIDIAGFDILILISSSISIYSLFFYIYSKIIKNKKDSFKEKMEKKEEKINKLIKKIENSKYGYKNLFKESIETFRYLNKNLSTGYAQKIMDINQEIINGEFYKSILITKQFNKYTYYAKELKYLHYIMDTEYVSDKIEENKREMINKENNQKEELLKKERENKNKQRVDKIKKVFSVGRLLNVFKEDQDKIVEINQVKNKKKKVFKIKSI